MSKLPAWDLSDLYSSIDDPKIEKDKKKIQKLTSAFIKSYQGKINTSALTSTFLLESLKKYEEIIEKIYKLYVYGYLNHSLDSQNHKIGLLHSNVSEFYSEIHSQLVWYTNEIKEVDESKFKKIIHSKNLKKYSHFLQKLLVYKPYTLSTKEEVILAKKDLTSSSAFVNFYDKTLAEERFLVHLDGKKQELTSSELSPLLSYHPKRNVREKAAKAQTETFKKRKSFYTFTLNNLLLDKKITDELRGYTYPEQSTYLHYELDQTIVDSMVASIQKNVKLVERYYKLKKKILKLEQLNEIDRYSPLYPETKKTYTWLEAKEIVLKSFEKSSSKFRQIAEVFFDKNLIDARLAPHKASGAYCYPPSTKNLPYVLCNFNGELNSVTTLAHELGHALHGYLNKRDNSFLQMHPSTTIAEIASIFAESLTFDQLMSEINDPKTKATYLAKKIEGVFASVFRQTEFHLFEKDIHTHRREKGELSSEEIGAYFQTRLQHMFGKGLNLTSDHSYWWMYILHFYHYNFYVFSYAFGELLSLTLYQKYKQDGEKFIEKYIQALSVGGSLSPIEITKIMDVNITDPLFWDSGIKLVENYINEFEKLVKSV